MEIIEPAPGLGYYWRIMKKIGILKVQQNAYFIRLELDYLIKMVQHTVIFTSYQLKFLR